MTSSRPVRLPCLWRREPAPALRPEAFLGRGKSFYLASVNDFGDEFSVIRPGNLRVFLGRRNGSSVAVLRRFSNRAQKTI